MNPTSSFYSRFAIWLFAAVICNTVIGAPHKLRVTDPVVAKSLIEQGGRLVADYETFQIIESEVSSSSDAVQSADELNLIELNARTLNTKAAAVQARRKPAPAFAGKKLHLVHFAGPIKPEWATALQETGVEVISYIPQSTYLIYGDSAAIGKMQAWGRNTPFVDWEGDYSGDLKVHPRARSVDEKGNPRDPVPDLFAIQLVNDAAANAATLALVDRLKTAPVINEFHTLGYLNIIVRVPANRLDDIASHPEVVSIQPYVMPKKRDERQDQIIAGNLIGTSPTGPGYLSWLASKGFSQNQFTNSGFAVDVTDSGVDNGTTTPGHFGLYTMGDPLQPSRVIYNRLEGTAHAGSTLQGCDGHGNLNSHIIAAYNDMSTGFPHTDSVGFRYDLGVCPFVKVGSSVIFDPDTFTSPNYANLQSRAYRDGARISANSWGADVAGAYNVDSQSYDALVRDAQPSGSSVPNSGNQQMVIVFASGNAGSGVSTVGSPGTGKNVITVGASENVRSMSTANGGNNASGNDGCNTPDSEADNANDMSVFSSRGPCSDGRQKPDIVAPGTHITGGVAQAGAATTVGTGTAISCFEATGVCALPGGGTVGDPDNFFPASQQFYTESTGTSHSTPAVAGGCALLRQFFINNSLTPPSPAMTKAFLVNASRYLDGVYANDNLWSPNQGMGEMNLGVAFDGIPRALHDQLSGDKFTASGQTRTVTGTIADSTKPFRVTVAWTDAPGNTTGNAFNNDLDLTVTVGGNTYKGNVFNGPNSVTGGVADNRNNVESVFLPAGLSGNFIVTVRAANINSDGVPNEAPTLDQDFALVVYNAAEGFVPVLQLNSTAVIAESCSPTNAAVDAGETVTVSFTLKNVGSANTTNLVATLLATNGVVAPSGPQTFGVISTNGTTVTRSFTFTAAGVCGGSINPVLQLQDGSTVIDTLVTVMNLGARFYTTNSATNSTAISVPSSGKTGPASPYPSTINISGVNGIVSKVTVTLSGFGHQYPDDVDALLVGPTGQTVMLLSDCGGGNSASGLTLTFDDSATLLPDSGAITSGTFAPTDYDPGSDAFSSPAPAGPYGPGLSAFNGLNPNGAWSLYMRDDAIPDSGSVAQGWRISITTYSNVCCSFNSAPTISNIPDVTTNENSTAGPLTFTVGDAETSASLLTLTKSSSNTNLVPNSNILFGGSGSNRTVTVIPATNQFGSSTITVTVSDGAATASDSFVATFNQINLPPTLSAIGNKTIAELATLTFTNTATDPDVPSQTLTYSISNAPAGVVINATNGVFSWTPTEGQGPSTNSITVYVSDNGSPQLSDSKTFSIVVTEVNAAPTLGAIADKTITELSTLTFTNSASDLDVPSQTLTYSLSNAPAGASIGSANGVFTWTPTEAQGPSTNVITVRVTDNGAPPLSDAKTFIVVVTETNSSPTFSAMSNQTVAELSLLMLTNVATDIDLPTQTLTYSLSNAPAGATINSTNGVFSWTPTEGQGPSTNSITVYVTDDGSSALSATNTFTIFVTEVNSAPALTPIPNQTLYAGATLLLTNVATDSDLPANVLTYSLSTNAPPGTAIDPTNGIFSWIPTDDQVGTNAVTVEVSDNGSPLLGDAKTFFVSVLSRPALSIANTGTNLVLSWTSIPGQPYEVQFKTNLNEIVWTTLLGVSPTNSPATVSDTPGATPKFYRLRIP